MTLRSNIRVLAVVVVFVSQSMMAASFAVGTCKPALPSFPTISAAVSTVPSGSTVLVCPGTYPEQVTISQPLTLQGTTSGNSNQAVIVPPAGGLATNAVDEFGTTLALQLWVDNVGSGPVNISNITVDGTGHGVTSCHPVVLGMFYENSAGTVNHVTIRNQIGNGCGEGFLAEGGSPIPTVTLENSSVHNVDLGIYSESQVSTTIKANDVDVSGSVSGVGIVLAEGSNDSVSGNAVIASYLGIEVDNNTAGSVSANTVMNTPRGIVAAGDGVSIISNKVFNTSTIGIDVFTSVAAIRLNTITNSNVGIDFACTANPNVTHNTINEAQTGIADVPAGLAAPNTYFNVATIRTGGC